MKQFNSLCQCFALFLNDPTKKPARVLIKCPRLLFTTGGNAGILSKNARGKTHTQKKRSSSFICRWELDNAQIVTTMSNKSASLLCNSEVSLFLRFCQVCTPTTEQQQALYGAHTVCLIRTICWSLFLKKKRNYLFLFNNKSLAECKNLFCTVCPGQNSSA